MLWFAANLPRFRTTDKVISKTPTPDFRPFHTARQLKKKILQTFAQATRQADTRFQEHLPIAPACIHRLKWQNFAPSGRMFDRRNGAALHCSPVDALQQAESCPRAGLQKYARSK
jgi:hypothetical protein